MCPKPRRTQHKRIQTRRIWKICTEDDVMPGPDRDSIAEEAARLVCREALTDYRAAKLKALDRLGMSARSTALPDNAQIDAAVIRYLKLFGGADYTERLQRLRTLAQRLQRQQHRRASCRDRGGQYVAHPVAAVS